MTDQNAIQLSPMQVIRGYMRSDAIMERFADVVGKNSAGAFIQSTLLAVASNEALQSCDPKSIVTSALRAATLRLLCDPGVGEAYIVPFKKTATLVIGYKGLRAMALRTGKYRFLNVANVYEGEDVEEDRLRGTHKIVGKRTGDNVVGRIAYYELYDGFSKSHYMTTDQIHAHARRYSKSYNFDGSVWKAYKAGAEENPMEMKTPFRLLIQRWGYLDPQDRMNAHLNEDETDEIINGETENIPEPEDVTLVQPEKRVPEQNEAELTGDYKSAYEKLAKRLGWDAPQTATVLQEAGSHKAAFLKAIEQNRELL